MALTITAVTPTPTNRTATATTFVLTDVGTTAAVNDMLVLMIGCDNSGAGGAATNVSSVTDTKSNTWVVRSNTLFDNGVANAGVEEAIYTCLVTSALVSTDDITITFAVTCPAVAVTLYNIANDGTLRGVYVTTGAAAGSTTGTPTVTTSSLTSGDTVFAHIAAETNAAVTGDADVTNGTWSTQQTATGNTGTLLTSVREASQWKTVSATATQTYNPTLTSCDNKVAWISIRPETIPSFLPSPLMMLSHQAVQRAAVR